MSYDWDLFISYPRRDPLGPWVQDRLFPLLDRWLGAQMHSAPRLFIDTAMEDGTDWPSHLRESLHRSKYLVAVLAPLTSGPGGALPSGTRCASGRHSSAWAWGRCPGSFSRSGSSTARPSPSGAEQIVALLLPRSPPAGPHGELDTLSQLAHRYENVNLPSYGDRVHTKDALAEEMGTYGSGWSRVRMMAWQSRSPRQRLAHRSPEIWCASLEAGRYVKRLHVAYRVLLAGRLVERERVDTDVRKALEDLLAQYDRMASDRKDSPLLSLVSTVRRRVANLT